MHTEIVELFRKYLRNQCSRNELREVFTYIQEGRYIEEWEQAIKADSEQTETPAMHRYLSDHRVKHLHTRIKKQIQPKSHLHIRWKLGVAATVLLAIGIAFWMFQQPEKKTAQPTAKIDVLPGGNKATLLLSDGQQIALSEEKEGIKVNGSQLAYNDGTPLSNNADPVVQYATLKTPKGGQYQLTLPDETKVWLNAASSIEYPTSFTGKERRVKVNGEAYFEVTHDANKPFKVETEGQIIEVLGTHFNVNAYSTEEMTRTTLLEGSVKVKPIHSERAYILKPNQQSTWIKGSDEMAVADMDPTAAVGWKNGFIHFDNADLRAVLRQLGRWYDVEVDLDRVPKKHLNGVIARDVNLSVVLEAIKNTSDVQLRIENRPNGQGRRILME